MKKSTYALVIVAITALGGFLFGFDMAVVSGIIEPFKNQFNLSTTQEGFFVSSALLGCMVGVAFSGNLSDRFGRKNVLFVAAILFVISAVGFAFAKSYEFLIFFRILAGMGVGVASNISPLYISEVAPAKQRGKMVTFYQLAITIGILVAYISNYLLQKNASSSAISNGLMHWLFVEEVWRAMFLMGVIPAIAFCLLLTGVPESPRWLVVAGRDAQAMLTLEKLADPVDAKREFLEIKAASQASKGKIGSLTKKPLRNLLILATVLTALSQFSGINAVIFYGPTILKSAGFVTDQALYYQVIIGLANMIFTWVAIAKVDSWGRRPLYIYGSLCATIALIITAVCFHYNIKGIAMLASIMLFLFFFAFSLGPLKFVISSEIFPTAIRGTALSICIMTMWVADWLVNLLFPVMRDGLGISASFAVFAGFCLISYFYAKAKLFETKGRSLEEIETMIN